MDVKIEIASLRLDWKLRLLLDSKTSLSCSVPTFDFDKKEKYAMHSFT